MGYTIYRWDDPGAPAPLNGLSNGNSLINVLDGCLVNGYGAKPAAGWSKPFAAANLAVYRQGAGSNGFYLQIDESPIWCAKCRGYEAMSAVDTGTNPFPTGAQLSTPIVPRSGTSDGAGRAWLLAADERRFFLWVNAQHPLANGLACTTYAPCFFFGDLDSPNSADVFNTLLACGVSNPTNTYLGFVQSSASNADWVPRVFAGTGTAAAVWKRTYIPYQNNSPIGAVSYNPAFPDPVTGGLLLSPIEVVDPGTYVSRGVIPWVWAPGHNLPGNPGDTFRAASGGLAGKRFLLLDSAAGSTRARIALELPEGY